MRDVYLWTGYALGTVLLGCFLVALYRRYTDWSDRRSYVPPTIHTEVRALPFLPVGDLGYAQMQEQAPEVEIAAADVKLPDVSSWALDALSDARKDAADTYASLGEFARRVPTGHAWIGMEVEASVKLRQLGRLAVAA